MICYKDGDKMRKIAKIMYLDTATNTIKTMASCKGLVNGEIKEFLNVKKDEYNPANPNHIFYDLVLDAKKNNIPYLCYKTQDNFGKEYVLVVGAYPTYSYNHYTNVDIDEFRIVSYYYKYDSPNKATKYEKIKDKENLDRTVYNSSGYRTEYVKIEYINTLYHNISDFKGIGNYAE